MKNTSFERVYGGQSGDTVEIHGTKRHRHWPLKILSVILAFLFWLTITNINNIQSSQKQEGSADSQKAGVCETVAHV